MISNLNSAVSELSDSWDVSENSSTITFSKEDISEQHFEQITTQVQNLRSVVDDRSLIFKLTETRDIFQFRLHWEPSNTVTVSVDSDGGTSPEDIFTSESAISALRQIRSNSISDLDELENCMSAFIDNEFVELSFIYRVDSNSIGDAIKSELGKTGDVRFYLQKETFLSHADVESLYSLKDLFISEGGKELFIIQDIGGPCYGNNLGFFPLSDIESAQFEDYIQLRTTFSQTLSTVGRECVIDDFERIYIPPDFFELRSINDEEFVSSLLNSVSGYRLLYAIFAFSNVVRQKNQTWQIQINGKKILEEEVKLDKEGSSWSIQPVDSGGEDSGLAVTDEMISSFTEVFNWAYEMRVTDRVSVLRNIITLYTTTVEGLIGNIDEIYESSKSNFTFYARESVDEFIGMQQEVSNYLLETQREFSELRRDLASSLSRDLFRVFGFLVVTWVGIILQLERITTASDVLSISLIPVIFYLALSIRAVHGLSQQFSSLEDSRDDYYRMYKKQMNEDLFSEIVNDDEDDKISSQFQTDKWIYYGLFGSLIILSLYTIIDLQFIQGPISDVIRSILSNSN
ncbi:hypothetical protein [Halorubrum distributum]|nr:hypothetical protein [Halorubrum arcis]